MVPDDGRANEAAPDAESSTSETIQRHRAVSEALPDPAVTTDQSGYLTSGNAAFEDRFGYTVSSASELHLSDILLEEDVDELITQLHELVLEEEAGRETFEVTGITDDGRTRVFAASAKPLPNDGLFTGVALVLRDVTAQKRREEVFNVMDRALRHNLRTNVSLITGHVDILEPDLGTEHQESLANIREAAEWMYKLGNSLRTLQTTIEKSFQRDERVSVTAVLREAIRSVDTDAASVSVNISAEGTLEAGEPVAYALENIVQNAIVHNDADEPTVDIWAAHSRRDGWVDIHVADNGPGIPEFERKIVLGEESIDQLQHGSGIGLWITRWVIEVFDGELEIAENDPSGSVVTVQLPLADQRGEEN
jgi:PAS domain S-box-containing protein